MELYFLLEEREEISNSVKITQSYKKVHQISWISSFISKKQFCTIVKLHVRSTSMLLLLLLLFISGKSLIYRTCSSKLKISLRKTTVCIEESRPSEGTLCFCDKDKCNMAPNLHRQSVWNSVFLALICIMVSLVKSSWNSLARYS